MVDKELEEILNDVEKAINTYKANLTQSFKPLKFQIIMAIHGLLRVMYDGPDGKESVEWTFETMKQLEADYREKGLR